MAKDRKANQKRLLIRCALWFLAVLIVFSIAYFIPKVSGALKATYVARYDNVFVSDKVEVYLVRSETVNYAERSGTPEYLMEEGVHARSTSEVMKVGRRAYTADSPGILSYSVDGYETYFIWDNIQNITHKEVEDMDLDPKDTKKEEVRRGDPLFKIVDEKEWYMIYWLSPEDAKHYTEGAFVDVILEEEIEIKARIVNIYAQNKENMIVLKTYDFYPDLAKGRTVNAEVVAVDETGLQVKQSSIVTVDGNPGVYVKQINGDYKFVRVKILTLVGENAIVASDTFNEMQGELMEQVKTIKLYDEVLKNGKSMSKGGEDVGKDS
ncbi:MAG: HlyD family efflux transporter periplasmic adaptor subunit [Firmicutes bacterium]|jgi:putative membrane fusion protein|nr:HlyD family efflux transporter periplasmic adaptor subunit [Bacillota bacterium]